MLSFYTFGISYNFDNRLSPDTVKDRKVPRFGADVFDTDTGEKYTVKGYSKKEVVEKARCIIAAYEL